jgi:hypothetical protein
MSSAGFLVGIDDRLNPIVVKELRQAVKSRVVIAVLLLFLILQLGILMIYLVMTEIRQANAADVYAGRTIFQILQGILLGTCMVLIPAYAGVRLAAERSDTNVDLLFISTLRPRAIIAGKFQAAVVLILLIFSACAPFMTFTYLLRGIDIPSILIVLAMDFLAVLLGTQLAIFLGAVSTNWGIKILLGLIGLGCLCWLFGGTMASGVGLLESGIGFAFDSLNFWLIAGAIVTVVASVIGLLFTWSVAIVSPPSANRALPVRLYLLGAWLVTGGVAILLTWKFRSPIPLMVWMISVTVLFCLQILSAINEREQWGVRVARTIPRRWWLRGPAFLFYSGAVGGVLFAILLIASSIGLSSYLLWNGHEFFNFLSYFDVERIYQRIIMVMVLIALYVFNYCLTAVFLRGVLFHGTLKPLFNWVLALVLGLMGIAAPYVILFLFDNDQLRFGQIDPWWLITNPFATIFEYSTEWRRGTETNFRTGSLIFLIGWAALATVLCMPWAMRQVRRFRPPERRDVKTA